MLRGDAWGKAAVVSIGLAVVLAALFIAHHGWSKRFVEELDHSSADRATRRLVLRLGQIGYAALGAGYGIAGVLVVVAALKSQPAKATGLDVALKTLAAEPYGPTLLVLIAGGLTAFGVFTFFDARHRGSSPRGAGGGGGGERATVAA